MTVELFSCTLQLHQYTTHLTVLAVSATLSGHFKVESFFLGFRLNDENQATTTAVKSVPGVFRDLCDLAVRLHYRDFHLFPAYYSPQFIIQSVPSARPLLELEHFPSVQTNSFAPPVGGIGTAHFNTNHIKADGAYSMLLTKRLCRLPSTASSCRGLRLLRVGLGCATATAKRSAFVRTVSLSGSLGVECTGLLCGR